MDVYGISCFANAHTHACMVMHTIQALWCVFILVIRLNNRCISPCSCFFFHLKQRIRCVIHTLFIANSISNVKFIGDSSSIFCLSFRLFHTIYLLAMYSAHFFVNAISRFGVLHIIHEMCLHWGWRILGWAEPTKHAEKTPCWSVFEQLFYSSTFSISTKMIPIIYRRPTQPKQPIRNAFLFIFAIVELDSMCHIAK